MRVCPEGQRDPHETLVHEQCTLRMQIGGNCQDEAASGVAFGVTSRFRCRGSSVRKIALSLSRLGHLLPSGIRQNYTYLA